MSENEKDKEENDSSSKRGYKPIEEVGELRFNNLPSSILKKENEDEED